MPELRRPEPPYQQILKYYRDKIRRGEYREGDKLPSGREMREEWSVSRATASRVSLALQREGLARSVPGIGVVINAPGSFAADEETCGQCGRRVIVVENEPVT